MCIYKQISSLFTKHSEWTHLYGRHVLPLWQGIVVFLIFSPLASPWYAAPVHVPDTLCLSLIRWAIMALGWACPQHAVPVHIRNRIFTLIPLYTLWSWAAIISPSVSGFSPVLLTLVGFIIVNICFPYSFGILALYLGNSFICCPIEVWYLKFSSEFLCLFWM